MLEYDLHVDGKGYCSNCHEYELTDSDQKACDNKNVQELLCPNCNLPIKLIPSVKIPPLPRDTSNRTWLHIVLAWVFVFLKRAIWLPQCLLIGVYIVATTILSVFLIRGLWYYGKDVEDPHSLGQMLIYFVILLAIIDISYLIFHFHGSKSIDFIFASFKNTVPNIEEVLFPRGSSNSTGSEKNINVTGSKRDKNGISVGKTVIDEYVHRIILREKHAKEKNFVESYTYIKHIVTAVNVIILLEVFLKMFEIQTPFDLKKVCYGLASLIGVTFAGTALILYVFKIWDSIFLNREDNS